MIKQQTSEKVTKKTPKTRRYGSKFKILFVKSCIDFVC